MSGIRERAQRLLDHTDRQDDERVSALESRVATLEDALEDSRRLNERLSDVLDVVVELLVPAVDQIGRAHV